MASLALSSISWEVTPAAKRIHFTNLYEWTMESRDLIHVIFVHHWQELLSYGENKVDFSAKTLKISQDSIPPWHPTCIVFLMARLEMFWTSIELVNLGDVGERYYRVWKIWWSLSIYRKAIVWPINKVMYKQLQIGWHGVFFCISHDINIARYLRKIPDPFRFQQRGNYTIPAIHCPRGERSPSASRLGQRHLFQERRSHWTLAQITWDMEDLCPNRGNPPFGVMREGRHPGIEERLMISDMRIFLTHEAPCWGKPS